MNKVEFSKENKVIFRLMNECNEFKITGLVEVELKNGFTTYYNSSVISGSKEMFSKLKEEIEKAFITP